MADVAQLVRAPACDAGGWGFKSPHSPHSSRFSHFLRTFDFRSDLKFYGELSLLRMFFRLTNVRADQQLRRNRATQYFSYPDWKFDRLRNKVTGHYETYVDLVTGAWTKMRIEVSGDKAKLFVHDNEHPNIIVKDLKHGSEMRSGIGLFIDNGTEGFFKNLSVKHSS